MVTCIFYEFSFLIVLCKIRQQYTHIISFNRDEKNTVSGFDEQNKSD